MSNTTIIIYNNTKGTRHEFNCRKEFKEFLTTLNPSDKISSYEGLPHGEQQLLFDEVITTQTEKEK